MASPGSLRKGIRFVQRQVARLPAAELPRARHPGIGPEGAREGSLHAADQRWWACGSLERVAGAPPRVDLRAFPARVLLQSVGPPGEAGESIDKLHLGSLSPDPPDGEEGRGLGVQRSRRE
jgi:hypothetical protein